MASFAGQVIWVTGASSGIGEALVYELAKQGATLVLSARRREQLERVRQNAERPEQHMVLPFDITHIDTFPQQVAEVLQRLGRIDVLINNAGVSQRALVKDTALHVDRQIFETDFFGPVALTKAVLPHMLTRRQGQLVVVSSLAGLAATPLRSAYSSAKAAIIAFHDALRAETAADGISVSVVCPGYIATEIGNSALVGDGTTSAGRHPIPEDSMPADAFARRAVVALAAKRPLIVIAGKERVLWWLSRVSPALGAKLLTRIKVR